MSFKLFANLAVNKLMKTDRFRAMSFQLCANLVIYVVIVYSMSFQLRATQLNKYTPTMVRFIGMSFQLRTNPLLYFCIIFLRFKGMSSQLRANYSYQLNKFGFYKI